MHFLFFKTFSMSNKRIDYRLFFNEKVFAAATKMAVEKGTKNKK